MKQISVVLLSFFICLLLVGCSKTPPLEITKVWIVENFEFDEPLGIVLSTPKAEENFQPLTLTYSKDFNYSVEIPQSKPAHRFIAVEITPKSEAEFKFKPDEADIDRFCRKSLSACRLCAFFQYEISALFQRF